MKKKSPQPKASKEPKPSESKEPKPTPPAAKTKQPTKPSGAKKPRASGLNAAAQVLAKSKEPMSCRDLTTTIMDQGLWKTDGKTPAATINAAILREIKAKGTSARFRKVGRGLFAAGKA